MAQTGAAGYNFQTPTEQYLAFRRAHPPTPNLTPAVIADDPQKWRGQTLELEGRLSGIVRTDDNGALLMLTTDRSGSLTLSMSQVPVWLQSGSRLRVLAITSEPAPDEEGAVSVSIGVANLQVLCVASASDITAAETRYAAEAQGRSRRNQAALNAACITAGTLPKPGCSIQPLFWFAQSRQTDEWPLLRRASRFSAVPRFHLAPQPSSNRK